MGSSAAARRKEERERILRDEAADLAKRELDAERLSKTVERARSGSNGRSLPNSIETQNQAVPIAVEDPVTDNEGFDETI